MPSYKAFRVTAKYKYQIQNNQFYKIQQEPTYKPISASPDTQLDKSTKKNPYLYPQVHQEIL